MELIEGEIIEMPPIGNSHAAAVDQLVELLRTAVGDRAIVRCQGPIQLGESSEPQPDIALLMRRKDFYKHQRPTDTLLAIEVSDTTLSYDLHEKMSLYATHGVRELWVIDIKRRRLHVFRHPAGTKYSEASSQDRLGVTQIASLPDVTVDLSSLQ